MRVTQNTLIREFLNGVTRLQSQSAKQQAIVSSQKKLRAPSDDPVGAATSTRLRGELVDLEAVRAGVGLGRAVLGAQDAALDQAHALVTRAREIATQHASFTTPEQRQIAAEEVAELERELVALGNTSIAGRHVFGGLASGPAPFLDPDDPGYDPLTAYSGPDQPFSIRTGRAETVRLTTTGDQVFGSSLVAIRDLRQVLEAGADPGAQLDPLAAVAQDLRQERASVGGRFARLNDRESALGEAVNDARSALGRVEDADLTTSIVELAQLQNALTATLSAGRALLQTSILDFVQP